MFGKIQRFISTVILASVAFSLVVTGRDTTHRVEQSILTNDNTPTPQKDYGQTPLLFEENKGQTDRAVKFFARADGYQLFLTQKETVFTLNNSDRITMNFVGGNRTAKMIGENKAVTISNYFSGQDESKWLTKIPNYLEVWQKSVYQGIDVKFYGIENKQVEYDFIVSPNADASQIKLGFSGAKDISIDDGGNLILKTNDAELVQKKPIAFQEIKGERKQVEVSYQLTGTEVSFNLGEYDRSQTLVIDPVLSYLTYIGGADSDQIHDVAADAQGNAYVMGGTKSLNFHGEDRSSLDNVGIFVGKLDPNGQNFLYLTILESRGFEGDFGGAIALDSQGNAYIASESDARNYPTTEGSYQPRLSICVVPIACLFNTDAVVTKLDTTGDIVYSTYLGGSGSEFGNDIAVDAQGRVYLVGETDSGLTFPKKNQFDGTGVIPAGSFEAYLTVFTADGSDIVYSTGLGGGSGDEGRGVAVDSAGNAYLTGITGSNSQFPVKNAFQSVNRGGKDAFVAKVNPSLSGNSSLIYSTFLGGSGTDEGNAIAVNSGGQAVVTGVTGSVNFPLANAFRSTNQVNEAFVTVMSSTGGSVINSSFLGGSAEETGQDIKLGPGGLIYVAGKTTSNNFPLAQPFQSTRRGLSDAFVTKLRFGTGVITSSYLGGANNEDLNRLFVRGNLIYLSGQTFSSNLATTTGVIKSSFGGGTTDGYIAKINDARLDSIGIFRPSVTFQISQSVNLITSQTLPFPTLLAGARGVAGDFDGDGIDTTGSFTNGLWKLRNVNFPIGNIAPATFTFGITGDLPVVGDWNGDGIDTAGVYRPSAGQFFLTNTPNAQAADIVVNFGIAEDLPVAGDWNGDGFDSVGVFRPSTGQFFLTDDNVQAATIDQTFFFGLSGDLPTAGDWNADGIDTIGVWRSSTTEFFLTNDQATFSNVFTFGQVNTDQPLAGDWDGRPIP